MKTIIVLVLAVVTFVLAKLKTFPTKIAPTNKTKTVKIPTNFIPASNRTGNNGSIPGSIPIPMRPPNTQFINGRCVRWDKTSSALTAKKHHH